MVYVGFIIFQSAMPVDGYPGPGPYILRMLGWTGMGLLFFYMFQDRGTRLMKDKYEEEGRNIDKQKQNIQIMMDRLKDSPSNLAQVREQTTKERRKWANEMDTAGSSSQQDESSTRGDK